MKRSYLWVLSVSVLLLFTAVGFAFTASVSAQISTDDVNTHRERLKQELAELEEQIAAQQKLLSNKQRERVSLERDVAILDARIEKARLDIRARNLAIEQLTDEIGQKESTIGDLNTKLAREKESLAQLIRRTNEIDDFTVIEIILGNQSFSDFFEDIDAFDSINLSLRESFVEIAETKSDTHTEKGILENKRADQLELRHLQELQAKKIEAQEDEKQEILAATRGEEQRYQAFIREKEKTASEIRTQLFALRDTAPIPFAEALELAQFAHERTGIRPAFLLGILTQETNLGENVGQCVLTNEPAKGDGKGINTGRIFKGVMKPTRDVDPFIQITTELGLDPFSQVVSCPPGYGYGGAMGPAQFIPSTWMLYKDRIAKESGQNPPNPWDPRTAFLASALLLADNGGAGGNPANERLAALRYFAGWVNASKPAYGFYGDGVMTLAEKWQRDIDVLAGSIAQN